MIETHDPPPLDEQPGPIMRRHKRAFDRMLEGLVVPSDEARNRGVGALVELPACDSTRTSEQNHAAIVSARATLHEQQQAARTAASADDRARVYDTMLATCATCHQTGS